MFINYDRKKTQVKNEKYGRATSKQGTKIKVTVNSAAHTSERKKTGKSIHMQLHRNNSLQFFHSFE